MFLIVKLILIKFLTFIEIPMYGRVLFLKKESSATDIELPQEFDGKTTFNQLEVCIYMCKLLRLYVN